MRALYTGARLSVRVRSLSTSLWRGSSEVEHAAKGIIVNLQPLGDMVGGVEDHGLRRVRFPTLSAKLPERVKPVATVGDPFVREQPLRVIWKLSDIVNRPNRYPVCLKTD